MRYACTLADRDAIRVSDEHSEARWPTASALAAVLPPDHWLRDAVRRAERFERR